MTDFKTTKEIIDIWHCNMVLEVVDIKLLEKQQWLSREDYEKEIQNIKIELIKLCHKHNNIISKQEIEQVFER